MVIVVAALAWLCLLSTANPPGWLAELDLRNYFFPSLAFTRAQLSQGSIPLWNPFQLLGVPFAAALQPAVFYPLLTPFLVLSPEHALVAHGFVHLVLAGMFTWFYLGVLGVPWWGAAIGGVAYMLSPDITQSLYNTAFLSCRIWLPALLAAIELVAERPSSRRSALVAAIVAMILLSGSAQCSVYTLQLAALYACFTFARRGPFPGRSLGLLILGVVLGAAVAAVQLVPTLELASDGVRSFSGLEAGRAGAAGVTPDALVAMRRALVRHVDLYAAVLVAFGLLAPRFRRHALFFVVALVVTCDFELGNSGFVFPLYFHLPLGNLFQFPDRISFVSSFSAACLVGFGAAVVGRALRDYQRVAVLAAIAVLAAVAVPKLLDERTPRAYAPLVDAESLYGDRDIVAIAAKATQEERVSIRLRPEDRRIPPRAGSLHGFRMMYDYEPLLPGSYARLFSIRPGVSWRGRLSPTNEPSARGGTDFAVPFSLLDALAVRYYVDTRGSDSPSVLERNSVMPRAYAATRIQYVASDEEALAVVTDPAFDARIRVVVTSPRGLLDKPSKQSADAVRILAERASEVEIETSCTTDCLVVLSDLAYPGWEVEVDGKDAALLRANYLTRSVAVPAGNHRVRFCYAPVSFRIGAAISIVSLIVLALLAFRRPRPVEESSSLGYTNG